MKPNGKNRAIFFDRDGILNKSNILEGKPIAPNFNKDFIIYEDLKNQIQKLNSYFLLIVITNQPDISKGTLKISELKKMHKKLNQIFNLDKIYYCIHSKEDNCNCRKPKTGLFIKAISDFDINLEGSYMIGDRKNDMDAAASLGIRSIYVDYNYNEKKPTKYNHKCYKPSEALEIILLNEKIK